MSSSGIETVLCFDRDLTIDVNFTTQNKGFIPDDGEPVPLKWVKSWAHGYDHIDVWATGNQHLRKEAEIPGFEELHQVWNEYVGPDIVAKYEPAGANPYKPRRRRGLEMIKEFYDHCDGVDPDQFIVVDDVDVSDVDGYTHYFPWDFVDAVSEEETGLPLVFNECNWPAQSHTCTCRHLERTVLGEHVD